MIKMRILLYYHAGSRNHGCEAIVRTICSIFDQDEIILYSFDSESDKQFGIEELVNLKQCLPKKEAYSISERVRIRLGKYQEGQERYGEMLEEKNVDWAFAIGGDNYCYKGQPQELAYLNCEFKKRGVKTALVGCSIDEIVTKSKKVQYDLAMYDIIVARESLTYAELKKIGLSNVVLYPDTAFVLDKKNASVHTLRDDVKYVGINISPLILKSESKENILVENYLELIQYIIEHTKYHILLIPHVCVEWDNDLEAIQQIYNRVELNERIHVICEAGCEEIKGYVSKCAYMICARTHISIAAYSLGIPTMVVGYSIKSRGIAKDLFGDYKEYVLPADQIFRQDEMTSCYVRMVEQESAIRKQLVLRSNEYRGKLKELRIVFLK